MRALKQFAVSLVKKTGAKNKQTKEEEEEKEEEIEFQILPKLNSISSLHCTNRKDAMTRLAVLRRKPRLAIAA